MKKQNAFATPESWEDLLEWVLRHNAEDRPHLMVAVMMTWNYACHVSQSEKGESND